MNESFLPTGKLYIGDKLLNPKGNVLIVEDFKIENTDKSVLVYNFQVEDFHTYHVGNTGILVHNANYVGENGTQTNSTTTWKNGKTERIDVENGAPGKRDGNIHYHDSNNKKYYYDIETNTFVSEKTGGPAPNAVQKLLNNEKFKKGIMKALKILGE